MFQLDTRFGEYPTSIKIAWSAHQHKQLAAAIGGANALGAISATTCADDCWLFLLLGPEKIGERCCGMALPGGILLVNLS